MTEDGAARVLRLFILYPSANSPCANAFGATPNRPDALHHAVPPSKEGMT
jgi:hypothetical protein